jgi:hypothetical protein
VHLNNTYTEGIVAFPLQKWLRDRTTRTLPIFLALNHVVYTLIIVSEWDQAEG